MRRPGSVFFLSILFIGFSLFASSDVYAASSGYYDSLDCFNSSDVILSNWSNGSCFDCIFTPSNVSFSDSLMGLTINTSTNSGYSYSAAEYRTAASYGYGRYSVSMKPIHNDGVVSSFFMYTGPALGTQWDEIDIEFLGKNTNEVQFNTFTNGVSSGGHLCQLGFDASESFHQYGFDWSSDSITWYVDGNAVYTLSNKAAAIPVTPGRIMANVWNGKTSATKYWLNEYDGKTPLTAYYDYISWNPFSNTSSTVSSTDETVSAGDASSTAVTVPAEDASSTAVTVSSKVSSTTWKADDSIPQYTLENVYGLLRVTKSVSQTIPYAAFSGSFENTVSVPDDLSFQIKFINGFKSTI